MANERVTDQTEKTDDFSLADIVYTVDVSNTTDDTSGSGFKAKIGNLLKSFTLLKILGCGVLKFNTSPNYSQIQSTDWVIYMDLSTERLIIGIATDNVTTIPADLDDNAKFTKFYDGNELLS